MSRRTACKLFKVFHQVRRIVKATRISQIYELHSRMILQQIQCPLKANYPIIFFRAHSYIVGKYSLELPISQTSTFSKGIHYVRREYHERIAKISVMLTGGKVSLSAYIDNVLAQHFEQYREEIEAAYAGKLENLF